MTKLRTGLFWIGNLFLYISTVVGMIVIIFTGVYVFSAFMVTGKLLGYRTTQGVFLKHDNFETTAGGVFLNDITLRTTFGGYQRVSNVNVSPWDVSIKVNENMDTNQYIRATVIPKLVSRVLRDTFVDADRVILTVGSKKEAEYLLDQILECGRIRISEQLER